MKLKLIVLFLLFSISWRNVLGCSCTSVTLETELKDTPIIFTGKVLKIESYKRKIGGNLQSFHRTTFETIEVFKGEASKKQTIITDPYGSTCGYSFDLDSVYIVFGRFDYYGGLFGYSELMTGLCTRTGKLSGSTETVRKLKKLGDKIKTIESLSPSELYNNIWEGEKFIWTDEHAELMLNENEEVRLIENKLTYCESDSTHPANYFDSLFYELDAWNYTPTRITLYFEVDECGGISNIKTLDFDRWSPECQKIAMEFVRNLGPWKPATIRGVNVKSRGYYDVDFSKVKSP